MVALWMNDVRKYFHSNFTAAALKTMIVVWALFVIFLTLFIVDDNVWLLAGILAYEVLP